jgi:hypothetical protein
MLLNITPSLKAEIDELFKEVKVLNCKKLRSRISDDETFYPEYGDIQEYRMCNDGFYPGEIGDGYYSRGGAVYHDDIHLEESVAEEICHFYNNEDGIKKNYEEFLEYLNKKKMLQGYFKNVKFMNKITEIPFRYVDKSKITENVRYNRPRAFVINDGEIYIIQPERKKYKFISLPNKALLLDSKLYVG